MLFSSFLCAADIQDRTISRGFLSREQGFTASFSPVRPIADTLIRSPSVVAAMPRYAFASLREEKVGPAKQADNQKGSQPDSEI